MRACSSRRRRSRRARIRRRRYCLWIEYVGTAFHGSQRQEREPTVQSELEKALAKLCKHSPTPTVYFCGRTDAGVHATCATCHVDLVRTNASGAPLPPLDNSAILNALNNSLYRPPGLASSHAGAFRIPLTRSAPRASASTSTRSTAPLPNLLPLPPPPPLCFFQTAWRRAPSAVARCYAAAG